MNANDFEPNLKDQLQMHAAFAAVALSGIMAKMASTTMPQSTRKSLATLAYQMADEMVAESERRMFVAQPKDEGFPNYDKTLKRWDEQ